MIAHRDRYAKRVKAREARRKRFSEMGRKSAEVRERKRMQCECGPRRTPPGKLLKTVIILDPRNGEVNRYDLFKSFAGKRKIDLIVNRDTPKETLIKGKSATWFSRKFLAHLAVLPEIVED